MVTILDHKFFLTEIIGRSVYLKSKRIGRLSDLIIVETETFPDVTYFVVNRAFGYPSLLLPWNKLSLISNTEIVFDIHNPEDYEQVPPEGSILLKDHILDKKILDMNDHEVEVVYDIKLEYQHDKLYVSEVDFSIQHLLRRLGLKKIARWVAKHSPANTLSWIYVQRLPEHIGSFAGHIKLNVLKEKIRDIHPVDLADILEELEHYQRLAVFKELDHEHASDTLQEIEPRVQRELIRAIDKKHAAELINKMSSAQAADLLSILPAAKIDELLLAIDEKHACKIQKIIDYHDENILLFATEKFITMPASTQVNRVLTNFRDIAHNMNVIMYIYIVDEDHRLKGIVDFRELIAAEPDQKLGDIMTRNTLCLNPNQNLNDAIDMFARYGFRAIPIVNEDDKLLAVVSFRDIRGLKPRFH
jgi:CBS domain-containing protein